MSDRVATLDLRETGPVTVDAIGVKIDDLARCVACMDDEQQAAFFDEFFAQLCLACGTPHRADMQLAAIADELTPAAMSWFSDFWEYVKEART